VYRHPEGLKCGIGHLIPDYLYEPSMEGKSVVADELRQVRKLVGCDNSYEERGFLTTLQSLHDYTFTSLDDLPPKIREDVASGRFNNSTYSMSYAITSMEVRFRSFATTHNLTFPED
jgi:hypothetical protein